MIWDVDSALESLVRAEVLRDSEADIVFDAPTTDWSARLNGPCVDAFLYEITEDVERRHAGTPTVRENGRITGRRPPVRFYRMSYLLTAWTTRAADEHRLLGQLLENLVRFEQLPAEHLTGRLTGQTVPMQLAMPQANRSVSDLWSAVGGEMKPSLDLVLLVPLAPATTYVAGPPVHERRVNVQEHPRAVIDANPGYGGSIADRR